MGVDELELETGKVQAKLSLGTHNDPHIPTMVYMTNPGHSVPGADQ